MVIGAPLSDLHIYFSYCHHLGQAFSQPNAFIVDKFDGVKRLLMTSRRSITNHSYTLCHDYISKLINASRVK